MLKHRQESYGNTKTKTKTKVADGRPTSRPVPVFQLFIANLPQHTSSECTFTLDFAIISV